MRLLLAVLLALTWAQASLCSFRRHRHARRQFDLYIFAGPDDWNVGANDTMVVLCVNLRRRTVHRKWMVDIKSVGNEPHHMSFSRDRRFLVAGGLLSFARGLPSVYFFRTSLHHPPRLFKTDTPPNCTAADIGIGLPDGGLMFSLMGGPGGGAGGQLVRYDKNMNRVGQYPPDAANFSKSTGVGFNPHGITISNNGKYILSSDFIEPITAVAGPIVRWGAVRLFDTVSMNLIRTYTAPTDSNNSMGAMDVLWVGKRAIATCTATGKIYCLNPSKPGVKLAYDFGNLDAQPQILIHNSKQTVVYVSVLGLDSVYKFEARNPCKLRVLGSLKLPAGAAPHSIVLSPDGSTLMVTDYFLELKNVRGLIHNPGDKLLRFIDTASMTEIESMRVDFNTFVNPNVVYRPHGMAIL